MMERDSDVLIQVLDGGAGVGHAGRHHKGVEGLTFIAALKVTGGLNVFIKEGVLLKCSTCGISGEDSYLEEHGYTVELKLDSRRALVLVALWETVLQDRRQGDEGHGAVEGTPVDTNLQQENCINSLHLRPGWCRHCGTRVYTSTLLSGNLTDF